MDSHKGNIQVESTPGKGTLVRLFFPITPIEEKEKKETRENHPAGEGKILFIDDEETIITWARTILKNAGYDAVTTGDPKNVIEMLEKDLFNFDLVITDLTMPKLDGMELAEAIHRNKPTIPIILCSGFTKKIDFRKAKENGVTLILDKPLKSEDLLSVISGVLSV